MKQNYDPTSFFDFLDFGPVKTYACDGLRTLAVYCRGNCEQMEKLLEPTPFTLADDRFVVSVADFANIRALTGRPSYPYFDAAIVLPVEINGERGGNYYFEWEDSHVSVASGRELWGYPKRFAKIALNEIEGGLHAKTWDYEKPVFDIDFTFDDSVTGENWNDVAMAPHFQVRAVPEVDGPGFESFKVISRDAGQDFELLSKHRGRATVEFGPEIQVADEPFEIVEVLGAEYTVGNYVSSQENGIPRIVASFV
ncbi:acetoacetate decarboxylase family protein [Leucobacter sp. wl10]|uniref:acetoacetate decarboxylase family protein n=1 Tax=Leucobacter sp. wl10 TaxID=2304677 RepID=UPI000E5AEEF5|nr:acetoacetate decarboxylase family protein [Leucobacter sp. wl10]RGE20093.1 hypothetical protein D1J51_10220 [Leucobacter sp. wl10]